MENYDTYQILRNKRLAAVFPEASSVGKTCARFYFASIPAIKSVVSGTLPDDEGLVCLNLNMRF